LIALRRAGLTSLALTEELGANVGYNGKVLCDDRGGAAQSVAPLPAPRSVACLLVAGHRVDAGAIYLIVSDPSTYRRYLAQLALHFSPKTVRVLRATRPWVIEVRTQIDYFNAIGLGIPTDEIALAHRLGLLVVPRFQNDERFSRTPDQARFDDVLAYDPKVSTVIFFGLSNAVAGYPDHLEDTAEAFKRHVVQLRDRSRRTTQPGAEGQRHARAADPGRTVRVQAIAKTELDKLKLDEVVARYALGVRERNVRVAYLRPWAHQDGDLSSRRPTSKWSRRSRISSRRRLQTRPRHADSRSIAGTIESSSGWRRWPYPSIFVLLLEFFGLYGRRIAAIAYGATIALYLVGICSVITTRSRAPLIALAGALLFATAAI
jgi:hypothetical protein